MLSFWKLFTKKVNVRKNTLIHYLGENLYSNKIYAISDMTDMSPNIMKIEKRRENWWREEKRSERENSGNYWKLFDFVLEPRFLNQLEEMKQ